MNAPTGTAARVTGFVASLGVVLAVSAGLGAAVGPDLEPVPTHAAGTGESHGAGTVETAAGAAASARELPGGLMTSQDGYTLQLSALTLPAGDDTPVQLTVTGPDGTPVTAYDVEHGKRLHLIAVRRDLTGYQHVHPDLAADGAWSTALDLTPGQWRLFADFTATGTDPLTLGADLAVPGDYAPALPTREVRTAKVDGYSVSLQGDLEAGREARLTLIVTRDGRPVTDLQPYLGAYGHLVALREGDLGYLHVHPDGEPGDGATEPGPEVVFHAEVPSTGRYHLFLDFRHRGVVRTAGFVVETEDSAGAATGPSPTGAAAPHDDDAGHGTTGTDRH